MSEGHISINRNHQYYFQVHQQMFCCSRIWTDFGVKGGTEMYKERVHLTIPFWSEQLPKLELAYLNRHTQEFSMGCLPFILLKYKIMSWNKVL